MNLIRPVKPNDASAIAAIWNTMINDTLATFTTEEKSEAEIAALIRARADRFWVTEDAEITGFATYGPFRSGPGYRATAEHTIILSEPAQGQGMGRALMTQVQDAARAKGIHVLIAGISSANPNAMAFHSYLGFEETARMPQVGRKHGQWLDLILMQKTISAS